MRRNLGLIMALVVVFFAIIVTVHLSQEDEAQAINVFAKTSESGSGLSGFDKIWSFNRAEADKWIKKADMPTARGGLSASVVNGKIYVIGGNVGLGVPVSILEEYDPATDKWTRKADAATKRWALSTVAVGGKIYAIGGVDERNISLSILEEYDPATDKWTRKADMPTARGGLSASVVNGKIYVIGGWAGPGLVLSMVEEYNPVTNIWTRKADMPTARYRLSTSMVNGKIYAIGGTRIPARPDLLDVSVVEEYDPMTDKWIKKTKMPAGRETLSTSVVNGKIYAVGGSERFFEPVSTVEEYDPETNTWSKKADMPTPRQWLATSAVDGKIYAIGGFARVGALSTVEEYDTGFVPPQKVEAKGKLPISWGKIKSKY